jgi:hypothetical protein
VDTQRRNQLLAEIFERKANVLDQLGSALDAELPLGQRSLAKVVNILGFLPINVWRSETDPDPWRDRELHEVASQLAAALLNVIDWLRERAELAPHPDAAAVVEAMDHHRERHFDMHRNELARARKRGIPTSELPWTDPETLGWEGWREDERPLSHWLSYLGVWLGGSALPILGNRVEKGSPAPEFLYFPLELTLDLIDWLDWRLSSGSAASP